MHKIAIIKTEERYHYSDEEMQIIIRSITNWETVSHEDFCILEKAVPRLGYSIIEQPIDTKAFIATTVSDFKAYILAENARLAEEKKQRDEKALDRRLKKEAKTRQEKEKLFAKLAQELGTDAAKIVGSV